MWKICAMRKLMYGLGRHSSEIAVFDSSALSARGFPEKKLVGGKAAPKKGRSS